MGEGGGGGCSGSAGDLFTEAGSPVGEPDLDPGLRHPGLLADLLPGVDVGVLGPLEVLLQQLELGVGEGGPGLPVLPLDGETGLSVHVGLVAAHAQYTLDAVVLPVLAVPPDGPGDGRYAGDIVLAADPLLHQPVPHLPAEYPGVGLLQLLDLLLDLGDGARPGFAASDDSRLDAARLLVSVQDLGDTTVADPKLSADHTRPNSGRGHIYNL